MPGCLADGSVLRIAADGDLLEKRSKGAEKAEDRAKGGRTYRKWDRAGRKADGDDEKADKTNRKGGRQ